MENNVCVKDIVKDLELTVVTGKKYLTNQITRDVISRPGVEIYSGYFEFYEFTRIQILGSKEMNFFNKLPNDIKDERIDQLFSFKPPVFIFTHNVQVSSLFKKYADKYEIPILKSDKRTTQLISDLSNYLAEALAIRKSIHGVMVDINGVGVLITGDSHVGKSETALQLLLRGYTLICDDRVDVYEPSHGTLIANCPESTKGLMEVRGIGIVSVIDLFGAKAYRDRKNINLIVELNAGNIEEERLGINQEYETIFTTEVPKQRMKVQPGRNLASLVEVAAMNWRLKSLGKNASLDFIEKLNRKVKGGK